MQLTIYYTEDDKWLLDKIEAKAYAERRSSSALIMKILHEYFAKQEGESSRDKRKPKRKTTP